MKFLVVSDSHGYIENMLSAIDYEVPDVILHLGDHIGDCRDIEKMYPEILLRSVRGNCDGRTPGLDIDEFVLENKRFMMTHGHLFNVKLGRTDIKKTAINRGVDILLFGHTHTRHHTVVDGMIILNPGSIGKGTNEYAIIEIKDGVVECELKSV